MGFCGRGPKGIYGDLNHQGMIEFVIEAGPGANPRGHVLFEAMIKHFGDDATGVVGSWTYGSNLARFNELSAQGMSVEEAAAATWTGTQAAWNGLESSESRFGPGYAGGLYKSLRRVHSIENDR